MPPGRTGLGILVSDIDRGVHVCMTGTDLGVGNFFIRMLVGADTRLRCGGPILAMRQYPYGLHACIPPPFR